METNKLQNQDSNGELKLRMIIRTGFVNDETGEIVVPCQWRSASDFGRRPRRQKWLYRQNR